MGIDTLGHRRELRFWGWGWAQETLSTQETIQLDALVAMLGGGSTPGSDPRLAEFDLPSPRIEAPASMATILSSSPYDRLTHTSGKSFGDGVRMQMRHTPRPPDWVAFPRTEDDLGDLIELAEREQAALVPFGGGTSVCGGVESDVPGDFGAVISVDLQYLNRVLEIDEVSRAALIEAGAFGPELEAELRPRGLTLRHYPQSFEFSTLGGWIATRSGGHFASNLTHIDDFVENIRTVSPAGVLESRRLPGSGAGPSPDRLMIGSEGTLGFITRAWMRLQSRPRFRSSVSVRFESMSHGVGAVRSLSQSGLYPTNCRLLDPVEAMINRIGDGTTAVLVLGFESADHSLEAWMARALELCADHGGRWKADGVKHSDSERSSEQEAGRSGAAGTWRQQFLRAPYYRNYLTAVGVIADTFETAVTWSGFDALYEGVRERMTRVIREETGGNALFSCRFTHVYPDGPAPYFTIFAPGTTRGDMSEVLGRWKAIKRAANEAVVELGGTVTHHHAVGRDHRPHGYDIQSPPLFRAALAGARSQLDPHGIMNPGVLFDDPARGATAGGVLG